MAGFKVITEGIEPDCMLANKMLADNVIGEWPILSRQAINSLTIFLFGA
jgi:hypothetical protein